MRKIPVTIFPALILLGLSLYHGTAPGHGETGEIPGGEPARAGEADRTVEVEAREFAFDPDRLSVRRGETVRFVIRNTGSQPHDFTLGPPEVQRAHRREMRQLVERHGMDGMTDAHGRGNGPGNAVMIPPGETRELTWTFEKAGDLEFGCNVPGHYEAGMKGRIRFDR